MFVVKYLEQINKRKDMYIKTILEQAKTKFKIGNTWIGIKFELYW